MLVLWNLKLFRSNIAKTVQVLTGLQHPVIFTDKPLQGK